MRDWQVCRHHPALQAMVFGLPLVCEIGLEHRCRARSGAHRLPRWRPAPRTLPGGMDPVNFKSMLHDSPQEDADRCLGQAVQALAGAGAGGTDQARIT